MTKQKEMLKLLKQAIPYLEVARVTYSAVGDAKEHSVVFMLLRKIEEIIKDDYNNLSEKIERSGHSSQNEKRRKQRSN